MQSSVYERCVAVLGCRLLQAYGLTEGSGFVCHEKPDDNPDPNAVINTVGCSTERVALMLRNADGQPSGEGEVGEILISGQRVFLEYWNDPKATATAFSGGWYQTGDLAVRDAAGRYRIVGRAKEMIISGGENIYPAEVVNALVSHPAVVEAAVFGVPSERWGEEVRAVVHLVAGADADISAEDLLAYCRTQIAGYKTPKQIELSAAPLPKTGIGKIAVSAVRQAQILKELS
jgi:acyl-CoA synthetase (AMP-forming)/AMP-acid ligase II